MNFKLCRVIFPLVWCAFSFIFFFTKTDMKLFLLTFIRPFCLASSTVTDSFEEDFTTLMTHKLGTDFKWSTNKVIGE